MSRKGKTAVIMLQWKPFGAKILGGNQGYKEPEYGIVLTDNNKKCVACGRCLEICPWNSPQFYDTNFKKYGAHDPARPRMTKCTLCIDRIREGLKPACVAACIMRALDAGPMNELKKTTLTGWSM